MEPPFGGWLLPWSSVTHFPLIESSDEEVGSMRSAIDKPNKSPKSTDGIYGNKLP
jgi:hypothetical protein